MSLFDYVHSAAKMWSLIPAFLASTLYAGVAIELTSPEAGGSFRPLVDIPGLQTE